MANGTRRGAAGLASVLLPLVLFIASCGPKVDLKQTLRVTDISTGWFDAGIVEGRNKLVPSVTLRIRKTVDVNLRPLSLNVAFKRLNGQTEEESDEVFLQRVDFAEGMQTAPLTVRAEHGYTADPPQTRAQMLKHSQFRDMRAVIFAKHSSSQWVELTRVDIQRQLILK